MTTNDHILASSSPTKSQSVVNDSNGECKHTKKEVPGQNMVKVVPCTLKVGNCMEEMKKTKFS